MQRGSHVLGSLPTHKRGCATRNGGAVTTTRLKTGRFEKSNRPARIYWPTRWRLLWSARSDRRAGLPIGLSVDTTPVLRGLVARRDDACERERTCYFSDVRSADVRLAQIEAELPARRRQLDQNTTEARRLSANPTEKQLTLRHAGEHGLPAELIRQRREKEHQRLADAALAAQVDAQRRLDFLLSEQAQLDAQRQNRADLARSRAHRYVERADGLAATYRRALVRRHPQREALVDAWTTDLCPPPAWVLADELMPSHRPTGAAA